MAKLETVSLVPSEYPDQVLSTGKVTLGEKARQYKGKKGQTDKKKLQKERILRAAVALLNSGGGIVCVEIENENYNYDEDGIGQDLEMDLKRLVNPSAIGDYFEFLQIGMSFLIFVKSWSSTGDRARLCSIDTGLRERSTTSVLNVENIAVAEFLKKKKRNRNLAQGQSEKPVTKRRRMLSGNRPNVQQLFERQEVQLGDTLSFGESASVEFKSFSKESNLLKRLSECLPKYISAFANTNGGYIFIGIDDETKEVVGCGKGFKCSDLKTRVNDICCKIIRVHSSDCTPENDWSVEVHILNVLGGSSDEPLYVVAIHVPIFCCAVFEKHPDSWHLDNTEVCLIEAEVWLKQMQMTDPDNELCSQFKKVLSLNTAPPKCKPVYGLTEAHLGSLQQKLFPVYVDKVTITPEPLKDKLWKEYPNLQNLFMQEDGQGVLILSNSWAVDINRQKNKEVLCEALHISELTPPTLYCLVEKESSELWEYARDTAFHLKQKLVNLGGYSEWVCVIPQLVNCVTGQLISRDQSSPDTVVGVQYPECYKLVNMTTVESLLQALVIVVMSFTSVLSNQCGQEFLNMLTIEQFQTLQSKFDVEDIRQLFVHGYPGTGKTSLATLLIRKIKNTFRCETCNILYICENVPLKTIIEKENICQSETRTSFMSYNFHNIKHIVVDEAQNFRLEDGNWYEKAKKMVERENGVFWIFLDYFQKCHVDCNGLPLPSEQTSKTMLSVPLRNSVAVHNKVCEHLDKIRNSTSASTIKKCMEKLIDGKDCKHSFPGHYENIITANILSTLTSLVQKLLNQGNSPKDIAILCSVYGDVQRYKDILQVKRQHPVQAEQINDNGIVVDSVRRFSGLERNIVILINPEVHPRHYEIRDQFLLSAISRARIQLFWISAK